MLSKSCKYFSTIIQNQTTPLSVAYHFDPENWPLLTWKYPEEEPMGEESVVEMEVRMEEEMMVDSGKKASKIELIEENRKDGHAPIKTALSALMQGLQKASTMSTSLSDIDVTLFNFHSTKFAERLLAKNVSSVVIVESAHSFSKNAKKFASSYPNVSAYRADISTLMGVGRKKIAKLPSKLLFADFTSSKNANMDNIRALSINDEMITVDGPKRIRKPHLVTVLPTVTAQKHIVDSLMNHAILHHSKIDNDTIFRYGDTNLLTFLNCGVLAQYICNSDIRLHFHSHQNRRHSAIFEKLFDLQFLHTRESDDDSNTLIPIGHSTKSFHPILPSPKKVAHEKKLIDVNFMPGLQYGVRIEPRRMIKIGDCVISGKELIPFAYFMMIIGRQPNAKMANNVFEELFPQSTLPTYDEKIGAIPVEELEHIFWKCLDELEQMANYQVFRHELMIKRT